MSLRTNLNDVFIDPISYDLMRDPIIVNPCGHTFERTNINGWMARKIGLGQVADCPLCRVSVVNLIPNLLIKQGLEVLNSPDNSDFTKIEDLTDDEQDKLQAAITAIMERRRADQSGGIPDRLPKPETFISKVIDALDKFYCSK